MTASALHNYPCRRFHNTYEKTPLWTSNDVSGVWNGRCSLRNLFWWTRDPGMKARLKPCPYPDEWILAFCYKPKQLKVVRGTYSLLYCLLFRISSMFPKRMFGNDNYHLLQADDCLVCTCHPSIHSQFKELSVFSMSEGHLQEYHYQVSSERVTVPPEG